MGQLVEPTSNPLDLLVLHSLRPQPEASSIRSDSPVANDFNVRIKRAAQWSDVDKVSSALSLTRDVVIYMHEQRCYLVLCLSQEHQ